MNFEKFVPGQLLTPWQEMRAWSRHPPTGTNDNFIWLQKGSFVILINYEALSDDHTDVCVLTSEGIYGVSSIMRVYLTGAYRDDA